MLNHKDEEFWQAITIPEHEILYIPAEDLERYFIKYDDEGNTPPPQGVQASKIKRKGDGKLYRFARFHPADAIVMKMLALEEIVQDVYHDGPFSDMSISYRVDPEAFDHKDPIEQSIFLVDQRKDNLGPDDVEVLIGERLNRIKEGTVALDDQKINLKVEEDDDKRMVDGWPEIRRAVVYFYLNASGKMDLEKAKRIIAKARND